VQYVYVDISYDGSWMRTACFQWFEFDFIVAGYRALIRGGTSYEREAFSGAQWHERRTSIIQELTKIEKVNQRLGDM